MAARDRFVVAGIILALIFIILTMRSCDAARIDNLKNRLEARENEVELGQTLNDGLDDYIVESDRLDDVSDRAIENVVEAGEERPEDHGEILPRMRRSDRAWRDGVERLCPDCSPDPVDGQPSGLSGSAATH
jgi:hypothetical protein